MSTENEIIQNLALRSAAPQELKPGRCYAWLTPDGEVRQIDMTDWMPARRTGTVRVADVRSFAAYFAKHADAASEVYADVDAGTITAVLDAHQGSRSDGGLAGSDDGLARWQEHRLVHQLRITNAWKLWAGNHRQPMSQERFAEFLEDNLRDVAPRHQQPRDADGNPVIDPAGLLELIKNFQATTKAEFKSGIRLDNGQTQLTYHEEVTGGHSKDRTVEVPTVFNLAIAPYDDCPVKIIEARFRYRAVNGQVSFSYVLDNPDRRREDAVAEVVRETAAEIGDEHPIMIGQPG